jgi:hypothetical protein
LDKAHLTATLNSRDLDVCLPPSLSFRAARNVKTFLLRQMASSSTEACIPFTSFTASSFVEYQTESGTSFENHGGTKQLRRLDRLMPGAIHSFVTSFAATLPLVEDGTTSVS